MQTALVQIFGSRVRAKLLGWFFSHANEFYFVRQLSTLLQEDPTNLSRELSRLEAAGILVSNRQGNLKTFRTNPACAFFQELKGLVMKTIGVAGQIKGALAELDGIRAAFIYGSCARGEEQAHSDVDLMLIGDIDWDKLDELMRTLEKGLGRSINYVVYDVGEFSEKKQARDGFLMDVLNGDLIMLVGERDDLAEA